jgi:hypothetical protein
MALLEAVSLSEERKCSALRWRLLHLLRGCYGTLRQKVLFVFFE